MNFDSLLDRFGAHSAEPVQLGMSGATVVRLTRGGETHASQPWPPRDRLRALTAIAEGLRQSAASASAIGIST